MGKRKVVPDLLENSKCGAFLAGTQLESVENEKVEVSAEYMARVREDYQDHTFMFDAKYNF